MRKAGRRGTSAPVVEVRGRPRPSLETPVRWAGRRGTSAELVEASHGRLWFPIFWVTWLHAAVVVALLPAASQLAVSWGRPLWSPSQDFLENSCPHPCRTRGFRALTVGGRCLDSSMAADAIELDTAGAVLDCSRASNARSRTGPRPGCCRPRWSGRRCTRSTRSTRRRCWSGTATRACRWPVRVHRWWRSSRSPSSPPPSASPPTPERRTSGRPSSCATASRGCGAASSGVT